MSYEVDESKLNKLLNALARLEDRAKTSPFFNVILSDPDAVEIRTMAALIRNDILDSKYSETTTTENNK